MKMNAIRLAAAVLAIAAAPTAMTADWVINDFATEYDWGWNASCRADIGYGQPDIMLTLSEWTMRFRATRGEDIYRPTIALDGDASLGLRRPSSEHAYSSRTCTRTGSTAGFDCEEFQEEFRITYSLSGVRGTQEAWVSNSTYRTYRAEEGRTDDVWWSSANVLWMDYPAELFATNEAKSLRINMSGSLDNFGKRVTTDHRRHQRINYSHGAEVMKLLKACMDRHVAAGRVDLPDGTASVQEIKSGLAREARALMEARHPR